MYVCIYIYIYMHTPTQWIQWHHKSNNVQCILVKCLSQSAPGQLLDHRGQAGIPIEGINFAPPLLTRVLMVNVCLAG